MTAVRRAGADDVDAVVQVLATAFMDDPVSCWLLPDRTRREVAHPAFFGLFVRSMLVTPVCGRDSTDRLVVLSQAVAARHPRHESHCHLPFLAVHPDSQGRGVGTALLRHRLASLDSEGTPAYLEATSPRNRALYERFGFVAGAPIPLPDGPESFPMWRAARAPVRTK